MLGKDGTIVVFLLVQGWVDGESLGGMRHLFVCHSLGCDALQRVNPTIAYPIAELLLLSPCYTSRQHISETFTNHTFFDGRTWTHLQFGVDGHGYVEEFLVEEGNSSFDAPSHE